MAGRLDGRSACTTHPVLLSRHLLSRSSKTRWIARRERAFRVWQRVTDEESRLGLDFERSHSNSQRFRTEVGATIPTQSRSVTVEGLDILELRGGKITRNEVYFD